MKFLLGLIPFVIFGICSAQASTLFYNINGYTMEDDNLKQFAALEFDQGKIARTYTEKKPNSTASEMIDGLGKTVLQAEILTALNDMVSLGMTSAHDAGVKSDEVRALKALRKKEIMPACVYAMLDVLDPTNDEFFEAGNITDDKAMMVIRSVKILSDGTMGSRATAMMEDYSDSHGHEGDMLFTMEELEHQMTRAMAKGF